MNKKGFTLVEMIIVLIMLTILMAYMVGVIVAAVNATTRNQRMNEAAHVGEAVQNYIQEELKFASAVTLAANDTNSDTMIAFNYLSVPTAANGGVVRHRKLPDTTIRTLFTDGFYNGMTTLFTAEALFDPVSGNPTNNLRINLQVFRVGEPLYTNTFVIRCLNIASFEGSSSGNRCIYYQD